MSSRKRSNSPDMIPAILDGKYFTIVEKSAGGSVLAQCEICSAQGKAKKNWKGFLRPTSNFINHLKNGHPSAFEEYSKNSGIHKAKRPRCISSAAIKQRTIEFPVLRSSNDRIDGLVIDYIIECMRPLNTVDQPSFHRLVKGLNPEAKLMSRPTLTTKIGTLRHDTKEQLIFQLQKTSDICLTADAWKVNSKSYFGVTAHWLTDDLSRGSAALALRRFKGSHNHSRIADLLSSIMDEFEINLKTTSCVTDNASNFVKAFKEFGANLDTGSTEDEQPTIVELEYEPSNEANSRIFLPKHLRCACHLLSLIAKDSQKNMTSRISTKALAKCSKLWNSFSRSSSLSDKMDECCGGKKLLRPTEVRWNSLYDSIRRVVEMKAQLPKLCEIVGVEVMSDAEVEFLEDYLSAMGPVASALDKLQSEKNCHYGLLGPTILRTVDMLDKIINGSTFRRSAVSLATDLRKGFQARFLHIIEFQETAKDVILAATCHPFFKLKWVPVRYRMQVKDMFVKEGYYFDFDLAQVDNTNEEVSELDTFFQFYNDESALTSSQDTDQAQIQCLQFLEDPTKELAVLEKYKIVRRMFLRYNTSLPSSAPVERFFSCAGSIMTSKRNRLSDELFEELAFLKINRNF